jgi:hypothetical protein
MGLFAVRAWGWFICPAKTPQKFELASAAVARVFVKRHGFHLTVYKRYNPFYYMT